MDADKRRKLAQKAIDWIEDQWKAGNTVDVTTSWKTARWSPQNAKKWKTSGHMPFAISKDGDLLMARGRKYDIIVLPSVRITAHEPAKKKAKKTLKESASAASAESAKAKSFLAHLLSAAKSTSAAKKEVAGMVADMKKRGVLDAGEAAAFENATLALLESFATLVTEVAKKTVNVESKNKGVDGALQHTSVLAGLKYISRRIDDARSKYAKVKPKDFGKSG